MTRASATIARSAALCREAAVAQRHARSACLSSRPRSCYARVDGVVAGTRVASVVRIDASMAVGTRVLEARLAKAPVLLDPGIARGRGSCIETATDPSSRP